MTEPEMMKVSKVIKRYKRNGYVIWLCMDNGFLHEVYCNWLHPETIKRFAQSIAEQLGVPLVEE